MFTFSLFILSGTALVTLTLAKRMEEKKKKSFFIFKAISKGDEHIRELHRRSVHFYSVGKDKTAFFVKKQLPMRAKNSFNKFIVKLTEQTEKYMGDIRDSRLLKKPDGISEFFKNMSTVEKGSGEINEIYEERLETEVIETAEVKIAETAEPETNSVKVVEKPKRVRKKSVPRKKLVVTLEE